MATLTIEISDKQAIRLKQAIDRNKIDGDKLVSSLIDASSQPACEPNEDKTLELLAQWREEDASMSPEEMEEEALNWKAFKANINSNRTIEGERPIYK